jgi:D-threo-aldose 1-dehydrogenase
VTHDVLPTRALGSTAIRLTEVGFGAASIGNLYRATTDEEAFGAVAQAWDEGIRYFDTAPHYGLGLSERRLGECLSGYRRDDFVVSTKVGRLLERNPDPTPVDTDGFAVPGDLRRVWDFSADGVRRSLDDSMRRLRLDHVDIVYAHDPDQFHERAAREALEALAELRDQGVVRAIGIGTNVTDQLAELFGAGLLDVAMLAGRHTLLERGGLRSALEPALAARASIVAVGVFNSGLLSTDSPQSDARYQYATAPPQMLARAQQLATVCQLHGSALPDAAIAFPLRHPAVANVTLGMRTAAQVQENLARYRRGVPEQLWTDLIDRGLIEASAVVPG